MCPYIRKINATLKTRIDQSIVSSRNKFEINDFFKFVHAQLPWVINVH